LTLLFLLIWSPFVPAWLCKHRTALGPEGQRASAFAQRSGGPP
jgi:hypothetical protein